MEAEAAQQQDDDRQRDVKPQASSLPRLSRPFHRPTTVMKIFSDLRNRGTRRSSNFVSVESAFRASIAEKTSTRR